MRALMWFRSDLRVEDNTALHHACHDSDDGVVAVFNIPTDQWRDHNWGGNKAGFVLRSVCALKERLDTLNIPLKILHTKRFDTVPDHLAKLARSCACDALYFNKEYEVNELARDEEVRDTYDGAGLPVHAYDDLTILPPDLFRTGNADFYSVYTPFKRKWLEHYKERRVETFATPAKRRELDIDADDVPGSLPGFQPTIDQGRWPAGEAHAKRRLTAFLKERIEVYHERRDTPSIDGTSALSPYLGAGVLSARACFEAAREANGGVAALDGDGAASWMNELVWREFYKHVLVGFPRVCRDRPFQAKTRKIEWSHDDEHFEAWCEGRTGFPIVDAGMRQLEATGWMHNRLRMIVAMFLTKDLFIDWRRGEAWFERHLVDLDFASNNGGWQWSASTGTDAQPYFRVFNPFSQSKRYDPEGAFIKDWVPELGSVPAPALHDPKKLAEVRPMLAPAYPERIVDRSGTRDRVVEAFKAL